MAPQQNVFAAIATSEFVVEALSRVSQIAAQHAAQTKTYISGQLACQWWLVKATVSQASDSHSKVLLGLLPQLLYDLEWVCAWPKNPNKKPEDSIVYAVVNAGDDYLSSNASKRVWEGLKKFDRTKDQKKQDYSKKLTQFSDFDRVGDEGQELASRYVSERTEDFPETVIIKLHSVLRHYSACTCSHSHDATGPSMKGHSARLRLSTNIERVDGHVAFDMLFSSTLETFAHWQDLQLRVPAKNDEAKNKSPKEVRFASSQSLLEQSKSLTDTASAPQGGQKPPTSTQSRPISPNDFCKLLSERLWCRVCLTSRDYELHQSFDGEAIIQQVEPGPGVSLQQVLQTHRMSRRMKLVLAYIVSTAHWRYYDSPWMEMEWSSDSLYFFPEPETNEDGTSPTTISSSEFSLKPKGLFFASRPYFELGFTNPPTTNVDEYCKEWSVICRHPRLLLLGNLLLEIAQSKGSQMPTVLGGTLSSASSLNKCWWKTMKVAENHQKWRGLGLEDYGKIVVDLLSYKDPKSEHATRESVSNDVRSRKEAIYTLVVRPLEQRLQASELLDDMHSMEPMPELESSDRTAPSDKRRVFARHESFPQQPQRQLGQGGDALRTQHWLKAIDSINAVLSKMSKPSEPIKLAVLDSGYDGNSTFFAHPSRQDRVHTFIDFTEEHPTSSPKDTCGHGTHTASVAMKIAPFADCYILRIAKDISDLRKASANIAKAITWAATEAKVDIISMSFGFADNYSDIEDAIGNAIIDRKKKLLFFAAASNAGANVPEMFPARLHSVISVRETNADGRFSDRNPPVAPDSRAWGTLGHEVSGAWLSTVDGEVAKSGSTVATAVMAGIAAMLLTFIQRFVADQAYEYPLADVAKVWENEGMIEVMERMSNEISPRTRFVTPFEFFSVENFEARRVWMKIAAARSG